MDINSGMGSSPITVGMNAKDVFNALCMSGDVSQIDEWIYGDGNLPALKVYAQASTDDNGRYVYQMIQGKTCLYDRMLEDLEAIFDFNNQIFTTEDDSVREVIVSQRNSLIDNLTNSINKVGMDYIRNFGSAQNRYLDDKMKLYGKDEKTERLYNINIALFKFAESVINSKN